jgi:hypothetical protein
MNLPGFLLNRNILSEQIKFRIKNTAYISERQSKTNSQLAIQLYLLNLLLENETTEKRDSSQKLIFFYRVETNRLSISLNRGSIKGSML